MTHHGKPHRPDPKRDALRFRPTRRPREAVILLVVLSMLAFLGILVVTYVTFTSTSRQSAFSIANRELTKQDPAQTFDEALNLLISGTDDVNHPLFGEDLLSDLYGVRGSIETAIRPPGEIGNDQERPVHVGGGFVRIPLSYLQRDGRGGIKNDPSNVPIPLFGQNTPRLDVAGPSTTGRRLFDTMWTPAQRFVGLDDLLSGRVLTFRSGALAGQSFRVIRSVGWRDPTVTMPPEEVAELRTRYSVYIELDPTLEVTLANGNRVVINDLIGPSSNIHDVAALFYSPGPNNRWGDTGATDRAGISTSDDNPVTLVLNSTALNGPGVGYQAAARNIEQATPVDYADPTYTPPAISFQPRFVDSHRNTTLLTKDVATGDFDEPYDAPDYQNWFLSHTYIDASGAKRVIPSFHRPALINHLANAYDLSDTNLNPQQIETLVESIRRATFRPLSFARNQFAGLPAAVNPNFSGSSRNPALQVPLFVRQPGQLGQMQQLSRFVDALVNGPWDVDNDGDGQGDSMWVDFGLPTVSSPEGKLIRPLIAPMIEDLSARLNVNAHGTTLSTVVLDSRSSEPWGGSTRTDQSREVFRGIGYGPAEIVFPTGGAGVVHPEGRAIEFGDLALLMNERHRPTAGGAPPIPYAGHPENDLLDVLINRPRAAVRDATSLFGLSVDPFGRSGLGLHRSGRLFMASSGRVRNAGGMDLPGMVSAANATAIQPVINENTNDPYEADPTGGLGGDQPFAVEDMRSLLDQSLFGRDGQRSRLDRILTSTTVTNPDVGRLMTTISTSMDTPVSLLPEGERSGGGSGPVSLIPILADRLGADTAGRLTDPTTLRDEQRFMEQVLPSELKTGQKLDLNRPFGNGVDDNGNGVVDEPAEVFAELMAYPFVPNGVSTTGNYLRSIRPNGTNRNPGGNFPLNAPVVTPGSTDSRSVMAKDLYVMMMTMVGNGFEFPVTDPAVTDQDEYKARRIAQWAINVVDFRDPDSIMTPFEYDPVITDGTWDVVPGSPNPAHIVWGVESPEMVFTESLAFHDTRTRDTNLDNGGSGNFKGPGAMDDPDSDQVRVPQGSLFLELMCARPRVIDDDEAHVASLPSEFYTTVGNAHFLDLDRSVNTGGARMPVWRIAISEPHQAGSAQYDSAPEVARMNLPETYSFEPGIDPFNLGTNRSLDELGADTRNLALERFVFFGQYTDGELNDIVSRDPEITERASIFFNRSTDDPRLFPEQYLTLAPREVTHLGSEIYAVGTPPTNPSPQRFVVDDGTIVGLSHRDFNDNYTTPNTTALTQPGLSLVVASTVIDSPWTTKSRHHLGSNLLNGNNWDVGVGLNISEPLANTSYYATEPNRQYDSGNGGFPLTDAYIDWASAPAPDNAPRDQPADMTTLNRPIARLTFEQAVELGISPSIADAEANLLEPISGQVQGYRTAFLQRLADPTQPFDIVSNPYRTVDVMTLDMTVFSGEDTVGRLSPEVQLRPFAISRQRNGVPINGSGGFTLQTYNSDTPTPAPLDQSQFYFAFPDFDGDGRADPVEHTLNFLNTAFGDVRDPVNVDGNPANDLTIVDNNNPSNRGLPRTPMAFQEWLNRDFVSPYELMLVPACSQARLFEEFTLNEASATNSPYEGDASLAAADQISRHRGAFGHLLNFFHGNAAEDEAMQAMRLFDYVAVRPRFRGEVEFINPVRLSYVPNPSNALLASRKKLSDLFQAPFNTAWDGRRQGRLNLNTIGDYPVWMGLMFNHLTGAERTSAAASNTRYQEFLESRRGYAVSTGIPSPIATTSAIQPPPYNFAPAALSEDHPSEFTGAFRSSLDSDLAPLQVQSTIRPPGDNLNLRGSVEATSMLRAGQTEDFDPLFTPDGAGTNHQNRQLSSLMEYHTLMRMPNLVSNQSQTFLVRFTIGYFEVDSANGWLGQEYNSDIGRQKRYRGTYVIDRSVPVGFVAPGQAVNAENTILYSRIEN